MAVNVFEKSAEMVARPGAGTIAGIIGPEGAGKDSLMTGLASTLWESGWDVYAFPGYHLLNPIRHSKDPDKKFKVLSQEITPEDWVSLPLDLHDVVICVSEADTHFNSLETQFDIAKEWNNLLKQRRKRSLTILYNVQNWAWFNNRARWTTHIIFSCWDMYWSTRNTDDPTPRGHKILVTPYDCKGFYTGRPWSQGVPFYFNASKIWENFDTYEVTSYEQSAASTRVRRHRSNLEIIDGKVVNPGNDAAPAVNIKAIEQLASQYNLTYGARDKAITDILSTFLKKGDMIPRTLLLKVLKEMNISISPPQLGTLIHNIGGRLVSGRNGAESVYVFTGKQQEG